MWVLDPGRAFEGYSDGGNLVQEALAPLRLLRVLLGRKHPEEERRRAGGVEAY